MMLVEIKRHVFSNRLHAKKKPRVKKPSEKKITQNNTTHYTCIEITT